MNGLFSALAAFVAYLAFARPAAAAGGDKKPGFGEPGFVAPATPTAPVTVTGCSFARAGNQLLDVNTGKEISESEAQARAAREGCTVPPKPSSKKASMTITEGPPILVNPFSEVS